MTTFQQKSVFVNAALALIALTYIYRVFTSRVEVFGVGTHPSSANTTSCYKFGENISELQGCESIQVDPRTGLAYLACGNRAARLRWLSPSSKHVHSRFEAEDNVIVMDENNNLQVLRLVELDCSSNTLVPFTQEFRVHGFDIYWDSIDPTELTFMFVNHQRTGAGISIFRHRIGTKFLQFVKTVKSPLLYAPNDVVATSRSTFYATNDMRSTSRVMRKIEMLLGMPWGHVVYYGHEGMVIKAAAGISYPNGIARSADGNTIFVAASSEPSVNMYRPRLDGSLELVGKTVFRNFVPDNVSVDTATGQVLVSELRPALFPGATLCILQPVLNASSCIMRANVGFLNTFELFRYNHEVLGGTSARPASAIRRLRPLPYPRRGFAVENVLVDDGTLLPTTTMATLQTKGRVQRILLGSVMADHIAICRARPYSQYSQS